jgi:hypothetical protein
MIILVGITAGILIHLTTGRPDNESMAGDVADSMLAFSPTVFCCSSTTHHFRQRLSPSSPCFSIYSSHFACLPASHGDLHRCHGGIMYALAPLIGVQPTFLSFWL